MSCPLSYPPISEFKEKLAAYRPAYVNTLKPENQAPAPATVPASRDLKRDLLSYLHSLLGNRKTTTDVQSVTAM